MALGLVQFLNNVDDIIDGKTGREDMGGIWTSDAAKGGFGSVGDVAIADEGRKVHDDFLKLLMTIKQHSIYPGLMGDIKDAWMMNADDKKQKKRRKTNAVTQSTKGPTFNLLGSESATASQHDVRQMLNV